MGFSEKRLRSMRISSMGTPDTGRSYIFVTAALLIGFVVGVAYRQVADGDSYETVRLNAASRPAFRTPNGSACRPEVSTKYYSSDIEQAWLQNAGEWQKDYCNVISKPNRDQQRVVKIWMDTVARLASRGGSSAVGKACDPSVFSRYVTTVKCGSSKEEVTTWIEPLSHGLRHPNSLCGQYNTTAALFDMSYLLLTQQADNIKLRSAVSQECQGRACQAIYIDLGATMWSNNDKEAGQGWFYRHYQKHGITFDRMLLWEAQPITPPAMVYEQLPLELLHKYQYFNMPAVADLSLPSHPVNMLKKIAQPGDFVVLKLDIDNAAVEMAILDAFLQDAEAFALVDEFFFEHHVHFEPMLRYWGDTLDNSTTLSDSYQLFLRLRQKGWRAHSWV